MPPRSAGRCSLAGRGTQPATAAPAPPADLEAPRIAINYPPADARVEREQIVVLGLVTDNVGIGRVQVTVNGARCRNPRMPERAGGGPCAFRPRCSRARTSSRSPPAMGPGNVSQVVHTVTRVVPAAEGPPPMDEMASGAGPTGTATGS